MKWITCSYRSSAIVILFLWFFLFYSIIQISGYYYLQNLNVTISFGLDAKAHIMWINNTSSYSPLSYSSLAAFKNFSLFIAEIFFSSLLVAWEFNSWKFFVVNAKRAWTYSLHLFPIQCKTWTCHAVCDIEIGKVVFQVVNIKVVILWNKLPISCLYIWLYSFR